LFLKRKTGQRQDTDPIVALTQRVETLERRFKEVDAEWSMWYDKFRRLLATISKRAQRAEDAAEPTNEPEPEVNPLARRLLGL